MIKSEIERLVAKIHSAHQRVVIEFAGAGSLALFWLHSQGGSSRTILEAVDRYSARSTFELLGTLPAPFVNAKTAQAMASHAYQRGLRLSDHNTPVVGIGCTATIATDSPKRGKHSARVCVFERTRHTQYALDLKKGARSRRDEETLVSGIVLHGLARACGLERTLDLGLLQTEHLKSRSEASRDPLDSLLAGDVESVTVHHDGVMCADTAHEGVAVVSGSFNPVHTGHIRLARAAAAYLRHQVIFELPVLNADKGVLRHGDICVRLRQFHRPWQLVLTRVPLFAQKALLFRDSVFVIGYDTALRLLQEHYYDDNKSGVRAALADIQATGCGFLVAGRHWKGRFRTLSDLSIPVGFSDLFDELPEERFRDDTSSSDIREGTEANEDSARDAA